MAQALRSGAIDFASGFAPALYEAVTQDPNVAGHVADGGSWNDLAFNFAGQGDAATNHPAIHDLAVRQAVAHAIDKEAIIDKVYQGAATVGSSVLLPGRNGDWYTPIPEDLQFPYDPTRANQILDDAGYLDSDGDGVREMPDGSDPLRWQVMTITDLTGSVPSGQLVRGYLDEIGIDVELFSVNQGKATDVWLSGDWDAYLWSWGGDPDPDFMLSVFTTDQCLGWSDGCYSNPEYDSLYAEQRTLFDRDERKAVVDQMQLMLAEQLPVIVLNNQPNLEAYRTDRFTGYVKSPDVESGWLLWGYDPSSFLNLVPVSDEVVASSSDSGGLPSWIWIAVLVGAGVIIGLVVVGRRRDGDEELD